MPTLVPVVEGDGEIDAVPLLLRRLLQRDERWDWSIGKARRIGGIGKLRKELASVLQRLTMAPGCDAILILMDLDDGCPVEVAAELAQSARALALRCPVAIVLAHREYEAWFLASLPTIAGHYDLPAGLVYEGVIEGRRNVKGWLSDQMPPGRIYKETVHQAGCTNLIDIDLAVANSRSFRRFVVAVEELLAAAGANQRGYVSPHPPAMDVGLWNVDLE